MNDVSGHWIPPDDEDGNNVAVLQLVIDNLVQRLRERRTRLEDRRQEIPVADARKRLLEAR